MSIHPDPAQFDTTTARVLVFGSALDREPRVIVLEEQMTIAEVIDRHGLSFPLPTIAILTPKRGEPKPVLRKAWKRRKVRKGQTLAFVGVPGGGNTGQIIALVATLALAVAVPFAAPAAAGALFPTLTGTGLKVATALIGAGMMIGGTFLINRLLPPPKPPGSLGGADQVYTARASSNRAMPGEPIPCLYGRLRYPPPYATRPYAEFIDNDQYLYQLHCLTVGAAEVEDWWIGDTLVWSKAEGFTETFAGDTEIEIVEPGSDVTLFPANVITSEAVTGQTIPGPQDSPSTLGPFSVNPVGTEISRIAVDFVFVHGLYEINKKGKLDDETRELTAEYQEIDDNGDPVGNWIELFSEEFYMRTRTPQRITREVKVTPGRYQVRFSGDADLTDTEDSEGKTRVNRAAWVGLRGFVHDWTTPSGVTLIATKIRATEQISSQSAGQYFFTATRKLPAHDGADWGSPEATRSIAWAAADLLRNPDYGLGLDDAEYDLAWLRTYAATWAGREDWFDGLFDRAWPAREALDAILRAGRAYSVRFGSTIGFVRDEPKLVRRVAFTPDTIVKGSVQFHYRFEGESAPDHLLVRYLDSEIWRERTVKAAINVIGDEEPEEVELFGVTNHDHAWREGIFQAAEGAYRRTFVTFQAEREARTLVRGEPCVLHDPIHEEIGFARLASRSGDTLTLDRDFTPEQGETYSIVIRDKRGREWGPCDVDSFNGREVTLDSTDRASVESDHGSLDEVLPDTDTQEPAHVSILKDGIRLFDGLLVEAHPVGEELWEITLVNDDQRVHLVDNTEVTPAPWTPPELFEPIPERPRIRQLYANAIRSGPRVDLVAGWLPSPGAVRYVAEVSYEEGAKDNPRDVAWTPVFDGSQTRFSVVIQPNPVTLRVAAFGVRRGPWSYAEISEVPDPLVRRDDLDDILDQVVRELERETLETRAAVARGRELAAQYGAEAALARIAAAREKRERQLAVMDEQRARASVGASLTREIMASVEETFVSLAYFKEDIEVLAGDGISIAEFLQELGSEVRDEETGLEAKANISTLQQTLAEIRDNEAWAWAVEASDLVAQVTDEETGLDTKASIGSLNQTFAEIRDNEAWAWAQEATDLIARVTDEETGLDAKANISIFQKVLAEFADGSGFAWAVTLAETDAAVRDVETGLETKASITDLQELDTSLDPDEGTHALAVRVQTISSQVGQTANSFPDPMGQDPGAFGSPATHSATGWAGMLGGGWQITASGSNQVSVARDWIAASPGMEVTLSCKARVVGGDTTMALHIQTAQNAAGAGATNTVLDTTNSNNNVVLSGTHEMPAGHFFFRPRIVRSGGGAGQARWGEVKCLGPDILAGAYGIISRMQTVETTLDDGVGGGIVNDTTELKLEVFGDGGSNIGLINQVSNIEGDLDNMELFYGIHLSNNGKVDGLSLLSTSHGSGPSVATLDIVFDKVRFAVNDADNSPVTFLKVESGQIKLDGDLLATGSVKAGALAARSITLGNLAFQGFGNLVANPGAEAGVLAPHADNTNASGGTWSAVTGAGSRSGAAFFRYNPAGQTGPSHLFLNGPAGVGPEHVFCKEGDQFQFSFWARSVGSGNAPQVRSRIEFRNASGIVGSSHSSAVALTSSYQKVTHAATAPAGATYVVFMPRVDQVSGAALVNVDDCDARQVITDGGLLGQTIINGGHIKTDEVLITTSLQIGQGNDAVLITPHAVPSAWSEVAYVEGGGTAGPSSFTKILEVDVDSDGSRPVLIRVAGLFGTAAGDPGHLKVRVRRASPSATQLMNVGGLLLDVSGNAFNDMYFSFEAVDPSPPAAICTYYFEMSCDNAASVHMHQLSDGDNPPIPGIMTAFMAKR